MIEKSNSEKQTTLIIPDASKDMMFGHYRILEELGKGGMGKVYKAWDMKINRPVALKILIPHNQDMENAIKRFSLEAMSIAKLSHPNIVRLYNIGMDHSKRFFTMDYICGKTLHEAGVRHRLSVKKLIPIMIKVAHAIHYAHTQGIIHRDLKPANIIIDEKGEPFIMDFGLAKMTTSSKSMTQTGMVMGTPFYMSPEQAMGDNKHVGKESDVYSLGIILYELLTGKVPFDGPSSMEILTLIIKSEPLPLRAINSRIPKQLEAVCLQAINKKVDKRYKSAKALAEDLERFFREEKVHAKVRYSKKTKRSVSIIATGILFLIVGYLLGKQQNIEPISDSFFVNVADMSFSEQLNYAHKLVAQEFYQNAYDILITCLSHSDLKQEEKNVLYEELVITTSYLKKYEETLFFYQKLQNHQPKTKLAVAKTYYYLEDYEKAQFFLDEILEKRNNSEEIILEGSLYRGLIFYHFKNYQRTIDDLKIVENILDKGNISNLANFYKTNLFLHLGNCYLAIENFSLAQYYLEKAQQFLPDLPIIYEGMGKCSLKTKSPDQAKIYFEKCIALEPENSHYYGLLAVALEDLSLYFEANNMYIKALDIDVSNFDAMRGLLSVAFNEVAVMEKNVEYMLYYVNKARSIETPDLLVPQMKQIIHNYHSNYLEWMEMQKKKHDSPHNFLSRLKSESLSPQIYESVQRALLTLRYHPKMEGLIQKFIDDSTGKIKLRIQKTWDMIESVKQQEQKFLMYYYMAKIYLEKESISQVDMKLVHIILEDDDETILHRYLAAKTMLFQLDFKTLEEKSKSSNFITSLICHITLKEAGFPVNWEYFYFREKWKKDTTLSLLISKNMEDDLSLWKYFRETSNNPLVLLHTAANIAKNKKSSKISKEEILEARSVLAKFIDHNQKEYIRCYAHYYLWYSYVINKDSISKKDEVLLLDGLRNGSTEIKKIILSYKLIFRNSQYWNELANLMRNSEDPSIVHLSMTNLAGQNPAHEVFDELIYDANYAYSIRTMAFITRVFYINANNTRERKTRVQQNFSKMLRDLPKLKADKSPHFRFVIYFLFAMTGINSLDSLESEPNSNVQAHIILNIKFKLMQTFSRTNSYELEITKKYLESKHPAISKTAIASYIALSNDKDKIKMYDYLSLQKDENLKEGGALGFYSSVRIPFLRIVNWQSNLNNIERDDHYRKYIEIFKRFIESDEELREKLLYWLSCAIELQPKEWLFYERAIIYIHEQKYDQAISDIKEGLKLVPYSTHYICALAEIYYMKKEYSKAKETLANLQDIPNKYYLLVIADLYLKMENYEEAKNVFKRLCLLFPQKKDFYLGLADCYSKIGDKEYEQKYIDYANMISK